MTSNAGTSELGAIRVHATSHRGATPEELVERAMDKLMYVGDQAPPAIRDQARAFQADLHHVILFYLRAAVQAHNTTIANRLVAAGHPELVPILGE
jgi:hypothetical protein